MAEAAYRAVKVTVWNDEKFFTLSDDAKLVWFHVYTNSQTNGLGLYQATVEGLAAHMRWPLERYSKGFREGLAKGLFQYDETFLCVYFPKFISHNKPANPNVLKGLLKSWVYIPDTPLKHSLYAALKGLGKPFEKVVIEAELTLPQRLPQTIPQTVTVTGTVTGTGIKQYPSQPQDSLQGGIPGADFNLSDAENF